VEEIIVLVARPGAEIEKKRIQNNLEALQELVDGYIEPVTLSCGRVLLVNEEGHLRGMPLNRLVRDGGSIQAFVGPIVLARQDKDRLVSIRSHDLAWFEFASQEV
jgi:hypothetical protein